MKSLRLLLFLLFLTPTVHADALQDVRSSLRRFGGSQPVRAQIDLETRNETRSESAAQGKIRFIAEENEQGFSLRYASSISDAAVAEARAERLDPERKSPTRTALAAVDELEMLDMLNVAQLLLRDLERAAVAFDGAGSLNGKPARLLRFKITPSIPAAQKKRVKLAEMTLSMWLGADGVPLAVEKASRWKASFVVVSFESRKKETFQLSPYRDRLIATRQVEESNSSGLGQNFLANTTIAATVLE